MKKAVIKTGGKQYLVSEGDLIDVELLESDRKTISLEPLLIIADKDIKVGKPLLSGAKVTAEIIARKQADKVTSIRYKAKKRVHKIRGHRQKLSQIKITRITQ